MPTLQTPTSRDRALKWGGAAAFAAVILLSIALLIYVVRASKEMNSYSSEDMGAPVAEESPRQDRAAGSAVPATISAPSDLNAAEAALSDSSLDRLETDLQDNETDLATF